ncbi:MAG: glycosyltransferase [Oscillospiraceae bacterium]|nr:glycosyltransferase [Oscillospiraceae bacterium]
MEKLNVGLFNDSFPPTIDGVANVTVNYARIIQEKYGTAVVATPFYPDVKDDYPFEVIRYPSVYVSDDIGYRAGYPFDPRVLSKLEKKDLDVLHTHCPFVSTILARMVRAVTGAPIVFTYHTKFDIDIDKAFASDSLRRASIKFLLNNINACDEVWVVSEGAGENLRSLGYKGEYIVMENGTDFERRRSDPARVDALRRQYGIAQDETVFLFVGRMMWYKGVRISLDALRQAKADGLKFRFFLVGDGADRAEMQRYIADNDLSDVCVCVGAVLDRELLRDYFSLADLFLFPSTFDTNGIVVREAAACYCPSVLVRGSCAAEGIADGDTGILIDENAASMAQAVARACADRAALRRIGENAAQKIYVSWDEAVRRAYERYEYVVEKYTDTAHDERSLAEDLSAAVEKLTGELSETKELIQDLFWDTRDWVSKLGSRSGAAVKKNAGALQAAAASSEDLGALRDYIRELRTQNEERRAARKKRRDRTPPRGQS